jgi:hypothetical protein
VSPQRWGGRLRYFLVHELPSHSHVSLNNVLVGLGSFPPKSTIRFRARSYAAAWSIRAGGPSEGMSFHSELSNARSVPFGFLD